MVSPQADRRRSASRNKSYVDLTLSSDEEMEEEEEDVVASPRVQKGQSKRKRVGSPSVPVHETPSLHLDACGFRAVRRYDPYERANE